MNSPTICFQPAEVDAFLDGDLTPEELAHAEEHLASCEGCRSAIELAIGPSQWWSDVQRSLSTQGGDEFSTDTFGQGVAGDERTPTSKLLELLGPSDDPSMLGRIGAYEITALLGQGGMGAVFKGFDRSLNRFVAIKVLLPHLAASGAARQRFAREGQAVAAVVDNHVMPIHCVDDWHGVPYLVMPYARGVSLQKRLSEEGPLDVREILRIGMQAARGLAAAHAQGIVHRDVKPANILLDEKVERVQLMDFGLARAVDDASLTRSGMLAGTPQYMSPEQARAEKVDQRSDLFSLGAVLYAMCTGRAPFRAESSYSVLRLITDSEPCPIREINPDIPEWLCQVIGKLMAKRAEDRYQSAEEVAKLLETCLAHVQQPTDVPLPSSLLPSLNRKPLLALPRRSAGVIAMIAVFAAVVLAAVVSAALAPPEIAGRWDSEDWGDVKLAQKQPGEYQGTFTVTVKNEDSRRDVDWTYSGTVDLKWHKLERRFNGAWKVGPANGQISLRLVDGEIRGALTTKGPPLLGTPRLGDFRWTRSLPGKVPDADAANSLLEPPAVLPDDSQPGRVEADDDKWSAIRPSPVALVMLMHPAELEAGNSVQQASASVALGQLSSNDFCGILRFSKGSPQTPSWLWGGEQGVVQIGNRRAELLKSIANSDTGDFPQFDPALRLALKALTQVDAGRRHMIILTNGDPDLTDEAILDEFRKAKITISVVHIELHGPRYAATPKRLAESTGGRYYHVLNPQPSVVETIFRDEAAQLKRSNVDADREGAWETRRYHIEHLPLWTRDGKVLNPILLNYWIRNHFSQSWADGTTRTQFDPGQQTLTVFTSRRNHAYIESVFRGDLPQYLPADKVDAANDQRTDAYFVGDLPIWAKDGKAQNVFLLIRYLEQATDPLSWSVGKIHGSYSQKQHTLLIDATNEDQQKIAGALRTLRSELLATSTQHPSEPALDQNAGSRAETNGVLLTRTYKIGNLPLWSEDGKTQHVQLLFRFLKAIDRASWDSGLTQSVYHAGPQTLTVITTKQNHDVIAKIVQGSYPPFVSSNNTSAGAGSKITVSYPIADLPLWTKDHKFEGIPFLIRYLEWEIRVPLWDDQSVSASYFDKANLKLNATSDTHQKIVAALAGLRFEIATGGVTNLSELRFTQPNPTSIGQSPSPHPRPQAFYDPFNVGDMLNAVHEFNQKYQNHEIGRNQLPLTDDEVIASIRWAVMHDGQSEVPDPYRQQLRQIAEHRQLPPGWAFKVVTEREGSDGERFQAWSIRLAFSGTPSVPPYDHAIREHLLGPLGADGQPIVLGQLESAGDDTDSRPLAAAVRGFNASHYQLAGLDMPPLTEQEVIAAIQFQKTRRNDFDITDAEFARMQQIAETRRLPTDAEISVLTGYQPGDGYRYDIWSVRFSMRKQVHTVPFPLTGFTIRKHFVRSQSLDLDKIAWGPVAENGLQAGVRFEPRQTQYFTGQKVTPYFCFRNTGDHKFDISFPNMESGKVVAVDNAGNTVQVDEDENPKWIVGFIGVGEFGFGSQHEIRGRPIVLGDVERDDAEFAIRAKAGQAVRVHFVLSNYGDQTGSQLQTGELAFTMAPLVSTGTMKIEGQSTSTLILQGNQTETVKRLGRYNVKVRPVRDPQDVDSPPQSSSARQEANE